MSGATGFFAPLGRELSRVGLGTVRFRTAARNEAFAVLDAFAELGGNLVDTAAVYGDGEAERTLGAWLAARGARDATVILTKGAHPDAAWRSRMTPEAIEADLTASLERLGTDVVDIYMLHRDDPSVPVDELVDVLHDQVARGRARSVGGSNWTPERLVEAARHAAANGRTPLTSSSVYLGLAEPARPFTPGCLDAWDPAALAWYAGGGLPLFAWSAQSGGFFSDRFDPANAAAATLATYDTPANRARRERARALGRRRGVPTSQVALAWVLEQPFAPFALAGAREPDGVRAAWRALELRLGPDELRWLATGGPDDRAS